MLYKNENTWKPTLHEFNINQPISPINGWWKPGYRWLQVWPAKPRLGFWRLPARPYSWRFLYPFKQWPGGTNNPLRRPAPTARSGWICQKTQSLGNKPKISISRIWYIGWSVCSPIMVDVKILRTWASRYNGWRFIKMDQGWIPDLNRCRITKGVKRSI